MQLRVQLPNVRWGSYLLHEEQLANLEKGANSVSLGLLGLFGGIAFSTLTTIATVDLPDRTLAVFVGCLVGSAGPSLWFAYQAWQEVRSMRRLTARIRGQHAE